MKKLFILIYFFVAFLIQGCAGDSRGVKNNDPSIVKLEQSSGVLKEISPVEVWDSNSVPLSTVYESPVPDENNGGGYDPASNQEPIATQQKLKEVSKPRDITDKDYINSLKKECQSLGFKPNTAKFKQCVMELIE